MTEAQSRHRLIDRLRFRRWFKRIGIVCFIPIFFAGYFLALHAHLQPVTVMPATFVDRWIGLQPGSLVAYVSLWIYAPLAPALIADNNRLWSYFWMTMGIAITGLVIFVLWPTTSPPTVVNWAHHPAFDFLRRADNGRNACPSLHAAFALLTAIWLDVSLRQLAWRGVIRGLTRGASALWCLAILYSTMATKQHVLLDVLGGCALTVAAVAAEQFINRRFIDNAARRVQPHQVGQPNA